MAEWDSEQYEGRFTCAREFRRCQHNILLIAEGRYLLTHVRIRGYKGRRLRKMLWSHYTKARKNSIHYAKNIGIKTFAYDWHYIFDKSKNSIRYQINKDRVLLDSAAMKFHFIRINSKHFSLLYQNTITGSKCDNEKKSPWSRRASGICRLWPEGILWSAPGR